MTLYGRCWPVNSMFKASRSENLKKRDSAVGTMLNNSKDHAAWEEAYITAETMPEQCLLPKNVTTSCLPAIVYQYNKQIDTILDAVMFALTNTGLSQHPSANALRITFQENRRLVGGG